MIPQDSLPEERMHRTEMLALKCFSAVRAPDWLEFVESQSHGEPDFHVVDSQGHCIGVLEVTSSVDPIYQSTLEALHPMNGGGLVPQKSCKRGWRVWPEPGASVRRLRVCLDEYLSEVERAGIDEFCADVEHPAVQKIVRDLRLERGNVTGEYDGHHVVNLPGLSQRLCPDAIASVVSEAASLEDNLRKLSDNSVLERHLFLCVDLSSPAAYWQVDSGFLPEPVQVAESITHLWVAKQTHALSAAVLHALNGSEWNRRTVNWSYTDEQPLA